MECSPRVVSLALKVRVLQQGLLRMSTPAQGEACSQKRPASHDAIQHAAGNCLHVTWLASSKSINRNIHQSLSSYPPFESLYWTSWVVPSTVELMISSSSPDFKTSKELPFWLRVSSIGSLVLTKNLGYRIYMNPVAPFG